MEAGRSLGLGLHHSHELTSALQPRFTCAQFTTATMAAIYKPSEAIALLRPSFLLPRIQPSSSRRAPIGRFSTTRHARATSSPPNSPTPLPQRKSITLTGDTGQVRWSDLSPGEKVVRTTQQSFNFVVILVGVVATVSLPIESSEKVTNTSPGRRRRGSLHRRLLALFQNRILQSRRITHSRRLTLC
jgi:hypothetical protein